MSTYKFCSRCAQEEKNGQIVRIALGKQDYLGAHALSLGKRARWRCLELLKRATAPPQPIKGADVKNWRTCEQGCCRHYWNSFTYAGGRPPREPSYVLKARHEVPRHAVLEVGEAVRACGLDEFPALFQALESSRTQQAVLVFVSLDPRVNAHEHEVARAFETPPEMLRVDVEHLPRGRARAKHVCGHAEKLKRCEKGAQKRKSQASEFLF